ncbi:MAG: protein-L-isoaspartate O-methyltransferase family protein [Gammaproteobacteria bacterium]
MDIEIARTNMLKQQLRTNGVVDDTLLAIFDHLAREDFVPAGYYNLAYADANIPIGHGQVMLSPTVEAKILQHTDILGHEKVLEIGTGTGYLTALLAMQAAHVTTVDIFPDFTERARANLVKLHFENITLETGNAAKGWGKHLFDVIIVSGAVEFLVPELLAQLAPGGRLFAIVGKAPVMEACLITHHPTQGMQTQVLFETVVPALIDAPRRESFSF